MPCHRRRRCHRPQRRELELLFTRSPPIKGGLTEGPAVAPDGSIYFSDIPFGKDKGMILRFDPKTKKTTVFTDDSHKSNGLKFDAKGYLSPARAPTRAAARRPLGRQDRQEDRHRRPLHGQALQRAQRPLHRQEGPHLLHRPALPRRPSRASWSTAPSTGSTPTARVVEVTHDVEKPNGIALSPDQKTLYVADHNNGTDRIDPPSPSPKPGAMKIYAFPLGDDGLVNGQRKTLVDFGDRGRHATA